MADLTSLQKKLDDVLSARVEGLMPHLEDPDIVVPEMTALLAQIGTAKEIVRRLSDAERSIGRAKGAELDRARQVRDGLAEKLATLVTQMKMG